MPNADLFFETILWLNQQSRFIASRRLTQKLLTQSTDGKPRHRKLHQLSGGRKIEYDTGDTNDKNYHQL
jgi:hypothetical protein